MQCDMPHAVLLHSDAPKASHVTIWWSFDCTFELLYSTGPSVHESILTIASNNVKTGNLIDSIHQWYADLEAEVQKVETHTLS